MDRGDVAPVRARATGCLAGARLRRPQGIRQSVRQTQPAHAEAAAEVRRKMEAVPVRRRLVFLACAGSAKRSSAVVEKVEGLKGWASWFIASSIFRCNTYTV